MNLTSPASYSTQDILVKYKEHKLDVEKDTIHYAALLGDIADMEQHISAGIQRGQPASVTCNKREKLLGRMPIHLACDSGNLDAVDYLIQKRVVDLDAGDFFHVTALHVACIEDHYEVVRMLLEARATVTHEDVQGDLPMHWAATSGHPDIIDLLVSFGSSVDTLNKAGWSPLHRAAFNGRTSAAGALIRQGAQLDPQNNDGNTPLHFACFQNNLDIIELLLSQGARASMVNLRQQTCEDMCISGAARDLVARCVKLQRQAAAALAGAAAKRGESCVDVPALDVTALPPRRKRRSSEQQQEGFPEALPSARPREHAAESSDFLDSCMGGYQPLKQLLMARAPALSVLALSTDPADEAASSSSPTWGGGSGSVSGSFRHAGSLPALPPASPASSRSGSFVAAARGRQAVSGSGSGLGACDSAPSPFVLTMPSPGGGAKWQAAPEKTPTKSGTSRSCSTSGAQAGGGRDEPRAAAAAAYRMPQKASASLFEPTYAAGGGSCSAAPAPQARSGRATAAAAARASAPGSPALAGGRTRSGDSAESLQRFVSSPSMNQRSPASSSPPASSWSLPKRPARMSAPGELLHEPHSQSSTPGRPSRLSVMMEDASARPPDRDSHSGPLPRTVLGSSQQQAAAAKLPKFSSPVLKSPSGSKLSVMGSPGAAASHGAAPFGRPIGRLVYMMLAGQSTLDTSTTVGQ